MIWFAFSILSIFALAMAELTQQYLLNIKNAFNERASAVLTLFFQFFITIPLLFVFGVNNQIFSVFSWNIFPKVLLVTFISSVAINFYFRSFKVKNISISTIFTSFSAIVATIFGIIFFSESVSYLKFAGIAFILVAIVVANYKNLILEKNHLYGLAAGTIFGIAYVFDKSIVLNIHPLVYMAWLFLMVSIWSFIFNKSVRDSIVGKKFDSYKPIMLSGIGYVLFNFFTFTAYTYGGEVGRIDAINNSQIFLIILFEFFVLKHTKGTAKKIFSAILAIIGIFILGFNK